jgi:serine/threonine-protein kinase
MSTSRTGVTELVRSETRAFPDDHVALTSRRLAIAASIAAGVHLLYTVLYQTVWVDVGHAIGLTTGLAGFGVSVLAAVYLFAKPRNAQQVTFTAVAYELALTLLLAVSETWTLKYVGPSPQVPWGAVVIVLFPFLIPAPPRVVLGASLGAAGMTPLAMALVFGLSQRPWPALDVTVSFLLPPFLCALLAWAPTNAIYRLGTSVAQARRLGNYELSERLSGGGMGEVWRARHRLLARPAAVKLIKPEMLGAKDDASRERVLARFEQEAQVTANLDSPHTVELYDFGVSANGELFYVMELLSGVDVETLVQRFGALPSERAVYLLMQACDSLEDAHQEGLVHRDIKPANLFVSKKGVEHDFLKVLDFGLVKRWRSEEHDELEKSLALATNPGRTAVGQIIGTPAFLAPEAALGEVAIDQRADLYALGCVGYFMLTAQNVFEEKSAVAMALAHVTRAPEPPSSRVEQPIDAELERIVLRCLEKDRERRPASAKELRELLGAITFPKPWSRVRAAEWWREHMDG